MSSYHVLNAVWVGVFPMLAVSLVIGICCYILCCLNRLKIRIREYRKRNQPETVENIMIRQKRFNKINHFDRSIRIKRGHNTTNSIKSPDDDRLEMVNNNEKNNIVSQLSNNESSNYYYHYSKSNELNNNRLAPPLQQTVPNYYNAKTNHPINVSMSDYFEPVNKDTSKITITNQLKSSIPSLPQSLIVPQRTTTFSRSNLSLNLNHNHNRIEKRVVKNDEDDDEDDDDDEELEEEETDNEEHRTIKASDDEPEQLIVEELKESPKSTYSRYFSNLKLNRSPVKESSCSPINIIEIDQSPKTSRLNYLLYSRQNLNENKAETQDSKSAKKEEISMSETKSLSSESYERLTTNEFTSNRSTSISSLNEAIKTNKNSQQVVKLRKKNLNQNKRIKKASKKFSAIGSGSSYETRLSNTILNSPTKKSRNGSKLRLIALNKNKISSDIDVEDDFIFNDDTDSLSSAGISCTPTATTPKPIINESQNTLVNLSSSKFRSNSDNEKIQSKSPPANTLIKTSFSADTQIRLAKSNSCSISDIDPDDNILKNLLVKQKSKENT